MPAERTPPEPRRGSKPLVEKKRRARINQSLAELQALVVDTKKKQGCKQARVEKADILEMTVRYLQSLQKQQKEEYYHNRFTKFRAGYLECVDEVKRFLTTAKFKDMKTLDERLRSHLMINLPRVQAKKEQEESDDEYKEPNKKRKHKKTVNNDDDEDSQRSNSPKVTTTTPTTPAPSSSPSSSSSTIFPSCSMSPTPSGLPVDGTLSQSTRLVIPSSLPTGQLAFVVPTAEYLQYVAKSLLVTRDAQSSQIENLSVLHSSQPSSHLISTETAIDLCLTPHVQETIRVNRQQEPKPMLQELHYGHPRTMWRPW